MTVVDVPVQTGYERARFFHYIAMPVSAAVVTGKFLVAVCDFLCILRRYRKR